MQPQRLREGIKRARRVLRVWRAGIHPSDSAHLADGGFLEQVMRFTRCRCAGDCCSHRRYWDGPTVQERKADEAFQAQLAELGL